MFRLTEAVRHILIVNIIFFIATRLFGELMYLLFSLFYFENENFRLWQPLTHMFMHGNFTHIFFNMYALWAFGSPLEKNWGRNKFLFFYFSAGLGSALIHSLVNYYGFNSVLSELTANGIDKSEVINTLQKGEYNTSWGRLLGNPNDLKTMISAFTDPAVGASGAIYGLLVAFAMTYPNSELFLLFIPFPIKAKYFILILIGLDLFSGTTGFSVFGGGIAHFAHIGGALFGFIMMWQWKKNQFRKNRWDL